MLLNLKRILILFKINGERIFKGIFMISESGFNVLNFLFVDHVLYAFEIPKMTCEAVCFRKD